MTTQLLAEIAALLNITRPLVCLDLETTGTVPGLDRAIQIGVMRCQPNGEVREWSSFIDPQIDIPAAATLAHKITNEMVAGAPTFAELAAMLYSGLTDCDFIGQDVRFDLRFLVEEFARTGRLWSWAEAVVLDTRRLDGVKDPHTLEALFKKYCGKAHPQAHEALADVRVAVEVLHAQFQTYPDLPRSLTELQTLLWPRDPNWVDAAGKIVWRNQEACIGFGKHNGQRLCNLDAGFLGWVLRNDFPEDVKQIVRDALDGTYPVYMPPLPTEEAA